MKINVEKTSDAERKLNIEIPWDRYQEEVDRQLKLIGRRATVKGFRKGKAPMSMIRRIYSKDAGHDAVTALAGDVVKDTLAEHELKPFGNPYLTDVRTEEDKAVTLEAIVELEPVFEVADYAALKLEKPRPAVREEEIDGFISSMRERHGETVKVEDGRGLKEDDIASIDFAGTRSGEPVKNLDIKDYIVRIGKSELVPGFEEQIVGMKPGGTREFDLTFPEDFANEELAGELIHFTVSLKEIRELKLPEVDDEFARTLGKFENLEELKETIRKDIIEHKKADSEKELRANLVRRLVADNVFDVPSSLVDQELRRLIQEYGQGMVRAGLPNEKVQEMILANENHFKALAAEQIRLLYIISEIAEKEGMKAGEEEVTEVVRQSAVRMGKNMDELMEEYAGNGTLNEIGFNLVREKVFDKILETAKITEVEPVEEGKEEKKLKEKKK
ncbi:MAG: trigger factor [bacterium]|nr:trigger factor [bacterium]MDT8396545.1 trigger factor [bacterium]